MDHLMNEEPSSSQTFSFSSQASSCHIDMEVYYTAILRDPSKMGCDTSIPKRTFRLNENSIIMTHKESKPQIDTPIDAKVKIANTKKQFAKLSSDGYQIVAEVKFQTLPNNKNTFSLERPSTYLNHFEDQKVDVNSSVFYQVRRQKMPSEESQIIKDNDLVKFGKQIYQARIYTRKMGSIRVTDWFGQKKSSTKQVKNSEGECKICLMSEGQFSRDYVISPCKCMGTCSSVHIQCLKNWISQRIEIGKRQEKIQTYDTSRFSCEICKQKYPQSLQVNQTLVNISPQRPIPDDTLVLTKLFPLQDSKRVSHMVKLQKNTDLKIGRHYYNQLQLEDMSISRNHALIQRSQNGNFYLFDKDARFGTFLSLNSQINSLTESILLTSKQTFRLKLVEDENVKESRSKNDDDEMTAEKIEQ